MSDVFTLPNDPTSPYYEYTVPLDAVLYTFRFKFNARDEAWFFDLLRGTDGELLRAGVKVVTGWPLLRLYQGDDAPAGHIMAVSLGDPGAEATTVAQLGDGILLVYVGES